MIYNLFILWQYLSKSSIKFTDFLFLSVRHTSELCGCVRFKPVGINVKVQISIFTEYFYNKKLNFITRHSLVDPFIEILICQT